MRPSPILTFLALGSSLAAGAPSSSPSSDNPLPLIIWHGLGDTYDGDGIQHIGELASSLFPGIFVHTIQVGSDPNADRSATFFGNVTTQLDAVCAEIASHPILSTAPAVDAIGFSQGGQFLRGYVERCTGLRVSASDGDDDGDVARAPPVRSLMTFGSQHNGIVRFRACTDGDLLCKGAMALLRFNTWSDFVQARLVPAQYYRDPDHAQFERYLEASNFLADINNEREDKSARYAGNVAALENFVMVLFEDDTTVIPKETAWFEEVNGTESLPLRARDLYRDDWLGLRRLDRKGGLRFRSVPGDHMQFDDGTIEGFMKEFMGPEGRSFKSEEDVEREKREGFRPEDL